MWFTGYFKIGFGSSMPKREETNWVQGIKFSRMHRKNIYKRGNPYNKASLNIITQIIFLVAPKLYRNGF